MILSIPFGFTSEFNRTRLICSLLCSVLPAILASFALSLLYFGDKDAQNSWAYTLA